MIAFRVVNPRFGGTNALMACDVVFGYEENGKFVGQVQSNGYFLKKKADGTPTFVFPSRPARKPRDLGNGQVSQYENVLDLYAEAGTGERTSKYPTNAAFEFRKTLLAEMVRVHQEFSKENTGRGAARSASTAAATPAARRRPATPAPAAAETTINGAEFGTPLDDSDEVPF